TGREHASAAALVGVQRVHEFDFVVGVIALAGRGVDLPAALHLAALGLAAFDSDRLILSPAIRFFAAVLRSSTVDRDGFVRHFALRHGAVLPFMACGLYVRPGDVGNACCLLDSATSRWPKQLLGSTSTPGAFKEAGAKCARRLGRST